MLPIPSQSELPAPDNGLQLRFSNSKLRKKDVNKELQQDAGIANFHLRQAVP